MSLSHKNLSKYKSHSSSRSPSASRVTISRYYIKLSVSLSVHLSVTSIIYFDKCVICFQGCEGACVIRSLLDTVMLWMVIL